MAQSTNKWITTHTHTHTQADRQKNPIRIAAVGWFVSQIFRFYANSKKKNRMVFTHTMNTYIWVCVCVLFIKPVLIKYYSTCVNVFICQTQNQNLSTFHTKKKKKLNGSANEVRCGALIDSKAPAAVVCHMTMGTASNKIWAHQYLLWELNIKRFNFFFRNTIGLRTHAYMQTIYNCYKPHVWTQ